MIRRTLTDGQRLDWLRLARAESVGPVTFAHLIERHGDAAAALAALPELARRGGRASAPRILSRTEAEHEVGLGLSLGARLLACCEPDYPMALAMTDPPPPILWALGDTRLLSREMVAIVGARSASAAGKRIARDLAQGLGAAGWVVASGMARGIDAAAHEGSLSTGAVAVLAGAVDDIYPSENAPLYDRLRQQGCVLSERPFGAIVRAADFPRRNRIISGLSLGVVVVEAELRSGSLITARIAGEQGREVFAVPGSPLDPRARGCNDLLRQGATLVEEVDDILRSLTDLSGISESPPEPRAPSHDDPSILPSNEDDDDRLRQAVECLLSPSPTPINTLAREAGAPVQRVLAILSELALAGRVELAPGNLATKL